jgi:hypothetical protein
MQWTISMVLAAVIASVPAFAQVRETPATPRSGGTSQGYPQWQPGGQQQQAEVPQERQADKPHPGTLRKFNTNRGGGPEVEFETQAQREAEQQQRMGR